MQPQGAATPRCHDAGLGCCLPACTAACPSPLAVTVQAATSPDGFGSKAAQLEKSLRRWSDPLTLFFLKMHEMQAAAYGDSHTHAHAHTPAQGGGGHVFWHCTHAPGVRQRRWGSPGVHAALAAQISGYRLWGALLSFSWCCLMPCTSPAPARGCMPMAQADFPAGAQARCSSSAQLCRCCRAVVTPQSTQHVPTLCRGASCHGQGWGLLWVPVGGGPRVSQRAVPALAGATIGSRWRHEGSCCWRRRGGCRLAPSPGCHHSPDLISLQLLHAFNTPRPDGCEPGKLGWGETAAQPHHGTTATAPWAWWQPTVPVRLRPRWVPRIPGTGTALTAAAVPVPTEGRIRAAPARVNGFLSCMQLI